MTDKNTDEIKSETLFETVMMNDIKIREKYAKDLNNPVYKIYIRMFDKLMTGSTTDVIELKKDIDELLIANPLCKK